MLQLTVKTQKNNASAVAVARLKALPDPSLQKPKMNSALLTHKPLALGWGKLNNRKPVGFGFMAQAVFTFGCVVNMSAQSAQTLRQSIPISRRFLSALLCGLLLTASQMFAQPTASITIGDANGNPVSGNPANVVGDSFTVYVNNLQNANDPPDVEVYVTIPALQGQVSTFWTYAFSTNVDNQYKAVFYDGDGQFGGYHGIYQITAVWAYGSNPFNYDQVQTGSVPEINLIPTVPTGSIYGNPSTGVIGQSFTVSANFSSRGSGQYADNYTGTNIDNAPGQAAPGQDGSAQLNRSYTFTPSSVGTYTFYAVAATNYYGWTTVASTNVNVGYPFAPGSLQISPTTASVALGQSVTFTASVSDPNGASVSYNWQVSANNGSSWQSVASGPSATITPTLTSTGTYLVQCVASDIYNSITSNTASISVSGATFATPPASQNISAGTPATFSVTMSPSNITYQYQWYKNGTAISGATSSTYTTPITVNSDNGSLFMVAVTYTSGTVTTTIDSPTATLGVFHAAAPVFTVNPQSVSITNINTSATFTAAVQNPSYVNYQWQESSDGGATWHNPTGSNYTGAQTTSFTVVSPTTNIVSGSMNGYEYRCVASIGGVSTNSSAATLTIVPGSAPVFTQQPQNVLVTEYGPVQFTVQVQNSTNISFQWQENTGQGGWQNLVEGTEFQNTQTNSLTIVDPVVNLTTKPMNGYQYRCVASDLGNNVTSNAATLTIGAGPTPVFTQQPQNVLVTEYGVPAQFTVQVQNATNVTFQWQENTGQGGWQNLTEGAEFQNTQTNSLTIVDPVVNGSHPMNGYEYQCVATNFGTSATSNAATLTIAAQVPTIVTIQGHNSYINHQETPH